MSISPDTPPESPRHHESSADGTSVMASPNGGDTPHPSSLLQRLKVWARGLSPRAAVSLILFGIALVLMLVVNLISPAPTQLEVYIHGPEENVFIDGVPVTTLRKHVPDYPFAGSFSITEEKPEYEITIKKGDQVIHRKRVGKGAYLINATTDSWVAVDSVTYGAGGQRMLAYGNLQPRSYMIGPGGLGVYQIADDPASCRAVNFGCDPPFSIGGRSPGSRSSSSASAGGYVQLFEGKIEGNAPATDRQQN